MKCGSWWDWLIEVNQNERPTFSGAGKWFTCSIGNLYVHPTLQRIRRCSALDRPAENSGDHYNWSKMVRLFLWQNIVHDVAFSGGWGRGRGEGGDIEKRELLNKPFPLPIGKR